MRKLVGPILILIAIVAMPSCNKEENEITYHWLETGCSNPWNNNSENTEAEVKEYVVAYLDSENVEVTDIAIEFDEDQAQFCQACFCRSGNIIIVKIDAKDEKKILDLGFEKHE